MQEICIKVPDYFTPEQVEFIKQSAINQIEAEIRKTITIPQEEIERVEQEVAAVKEAVEEVVVEEPVEGEL